MTSIASSTRSAGFWSAVAATALSLTYVLGQLAEWFGWLGSHDGPESVSTPLGIVVLLTPSLFLGPAFVVVMASIHEMTAAGKRVWSLSALAFAVAYLVLIGMNERPGDCSRRSHLFARSRFSSGVMQIRQVTDTCPPCSAVLHCLT